MMEFLAENWIWLAIALLIGVLTAWWAWAQPTADGNEHNSGMGSGLMDSVTDTVSKTATGAVDVTKKAADTTVSTAKSAADTAGSAAKTTVKKTTSTAKKAASTTKKTASKAASGASKTVKSTASKAKSTAKKSTATAKKATTAAASKTTTTAKKAASTTKKTTAKAANTAKKTTAKAASKAAPKTAAKKPAAKKPAAKKAAKTVIPNDLELLKGVGPKLNGLLKSLGVTTFDQIANWKAADIRDVDSKLGSFAGRISRDNWVDQAKLLSKGDVKGFEKKYGSLGAEIKK